MLTNPKQEKPWAKRRVSCRDYEAARPWAKAGMPRQKREAFLLLIPGDAMDALKLEADTEELIEAMFGKE